MKGSEKLGLERGNSGWGLIEKKIPTLKGGLREAKSTTRAEGGESTHPD